jgi:hypothetical protein
MPVPAIRAAVATANNNLFLVIQTSLLVLSAPLIKMGNAGLLAGFRTLVKKN